MKKITSLLAAMLFVSVLISQTTYWTAYNMEVNPGQEQNVVNAIDNFMASDVGKTMPSMFLRASLFSNSETSFTHQVVFLTEDISVIGKMYSGILQQTKDFQLMGSVLGASTKDQGSYLGKSLFRIGSITGNFTTIIAMNVDDPVTYFSAFKKMAEGVNAQWGDEIGASLHQVLSGNEEDVTHLAVVSAPDFEKLLSFWDKFYTTSYFKEFNSVVKDIREVISNQTVVTMNRYNMP